MGKHSKRQRGRTVSNYRSLRRSVIRLSRRERTVTLEPLEDRLLLSAAPLQDTLLPAADVGLDLLLTLDSQTQELQLLDRGQGGQVILQRPLDATDPFHIQGGTGPDQLEIDFTTPFIYDAGIEFDGGAGEDLVLLSTAGLNSLDVMGLGSDGGWEASFAGNQFAASEVEGLDQQGSLSRATFAGSGQPDRWDLFSPGGTRLELSSGTGSPVAMTFEAPIDELHLDTAGGNDEIFVSSLDIPSTLVEIRGGGGADLLSVEEVVGSEVRLDGGLGIDTLSGPQQGAAWVVAGLNSGTVDGHLFEGFENLSGAANAGDAFVVGPLGRIDGLLDGGAGGEDTLTIEDLQAGPQALVHTMTGPQAGTLSNHDGSVVYAHAGFELVDVGTETDDPVVELTESSNLVLTQADDGDLITTIQHAFDASTDLSSLDGTDGFSVDGVLGDPQLGRSVHGAGDVNGDGIEDIIVGSPGEDSAYVIFGTTEGFNASIDSASLDGTNGFSLVGAVGENAGFSVGGGGDINGDGIGDVVIGAPGPAPDYSAGTTYVVFGSETPFDAIVDLTALDGTDGFAITGIADGDASGFSVAIAGDVNGDLFDDVILGAPGADPQSGLVDAGQAYLVFGSDEAFSPTLELAGLNGVNGFALDGENGGDALGFAVASAGDLNTDGPYDVVIGAPGADPNGDGSGAAYVFFGAADFAVAAGLSAAFYDTDSISTLAEAQAAVSGDVPTATFDAYQVDYPNTDDGDTAGADTLLADFLGLNAEYIDGGDSSTIGSSVFSYIGYLYVPEAGTYNFEVGATDGFSLAVDGATVAEFDGVQAFSTTDGTHTFANAGFFPISLLHFTSSSEVGIELKSDLSGTLEIITRDQFFTDPPVTNYGLDSLDGTTGFVIQGAAAGDALGTAVGYAGDINDDGPDDVIVGSPGADGGAQDAGEAVVIYGKPITIYEGEQFSSLYEPDALDPADGLVLIGANEGALAGSAVGVAGDLNADGSDDVVIGAPGATGEQLAGAVLVVFGNANLAATGSFDLSTLDGVTGFTATAGVADDLLGVSAVEAGDVNGDGFDDLLVGAVDDSAIARVLFGREVGGASTTIRYALPSSSFTIDGEDVGARITIGIAPDSLQGVGATTTDSNKIHLDGSDIRISGNRITIEEDVILSTRDLADGDDLVNGVSLGNSGSVVLAAKADLSDGQASVKMKQGATIYAHVEEGSIWDPGNVTLRAHDLTFLTSYPVVDLFSEGGRTAKVTIEQGATILGGDIDLNAKAGIIKVEEKFFMNPLGNNEWNIYALLADEVSKMYVQALTTLPVSFQYSDVHSTIEIGEDDGDAVTIQGSGKVSLDAEATADAQGDAIFWLNPFAPFGTVGFAFGLWIANSTSKVTLGDNTTVRSTGGNVVVSSTSATNAGGNARVSQNLDQGLGADNENAIPANPNNAALSIGIALTTTTSHVVVEDQASVIADVGNVSIASNGADSVKIHPETRSYEQGKYGVSLGFQDSVDDIETRIKGTVQAGGAQAGKALTFDPFTSIDTTNDLIDFGVDHGYRTGDALVYSAGLGGPIDGLDRNDTYYAIYDANNPTYLQLAASADDAENGVAIDLVANPTLTSASTGATLPFGQVGDETDWIDFGFAHGFAAGEALEYTAADGKRIGGLTDGETYYAVLVTGDDGEVDPTLLQLATDQDGTNIVDLDTDIVFTKQDDGTSLAVQSVEEGSGTVEFTTEHGLSAGDAIIYEPGFGFQLADEFSGNRYDAGSVFYAILIPSDDDPTETSTTKIRLALTEDDALNSNGYTGAIDFLVDQSIMAGTSHSLDPKLKSGIAISSSMTGKHSAESKARIGGTETFVKKFSRPEFQLPATLLRQTLYSSLNNDGLNDVENNDVPNGLNAETGQKSLDVSSAIIYQNIDRTVQTVIGSSADLESGTNISATANAEEIGNVIVEAGASQSEKEGVKVAIGASVALGVYTTTVRSVINGGAEVDASGELSVEAENVRRFPAQITSAEAFGESLLGEVEADPFGTLGDLNKNLLYPLFTTAWTYTKVAPTNADTALGFALQYVNYDTVTEALIANGAQINQDADFWTDDQDVIVDSTTETHLVNMAGVFEFGFKATNLGNKLLNATKQFERKTSPLTEVGVEGKNAAIGTSFQWTDINNKTVASVGDPSPVDDDGKELAGDDRVSGLSTLVHTGVGGKLTVDAYDELWGFGFVDSGAKTESGTFAFAGSGSVLRYNQDDGEVKADIGVGTVVTGGSVDVGASDSLILIGQNGSFITGNNTRGVGVGVNYWEIHRKVHAYIGDPDGTDTTGSDIRLADGSTIDVTAESNGFALSFALASDKRTNTPEDENADGQVQGPDPVDEDSEEDEPENAVGQGANAGQSGWSLAADVNYVDLQKDEVWAFIDDAGTFAANQVTVEATNSNSYINFAGSMAVASPDFVPSSNTGMAASFSGIGLERSLDSLSRGDSDTLAYIRRATVDVGAGGLAMKADRRGTYWVTAAGGSGVSRGDGFEAAGSAAWTDLDYATKAFVEAGTSLSLAGDSAVKATDRVATVAIAGDVVWGGNIGFGTSWAWNHVDRRIHAKVDDSTITQSAGQLKLDAVLWDVSASDGKTLLPNAYAIAGTLGVGTSQTNADLSGTVAVNQFNSQASAAAVQASLTGSSYETTADASDGGGLTLSATDNSNLLAFAGGIDLGASFTLGVAAAVNELDDETVAMIESTTVDAGGADVSISANINPEMNAFALGVAVSDEQDGVVFAGSGTANRGTLEANAHVLGTVGTDSTTDTTIDSARDVTIAAGITFSDVTAGAGGYGVQSGVGSGAFGAAVAVNDLSTNNVKAFVEEAALTNAAAVDITATTGMATGGVIMGLATGLTAADNFDLGGSVVKNTIDPTTDAHISGATGDISASGGVTLSAKEDGLVVAAGAGLLSEERSSGGIGSVGAAVPTNVVDSTAKAYVDTASVASDGSVSISADRKNAQVVAVAFGGEGAADFALGGSVATNDVTHTTDAHVSGGSEISGDTGTSVLATEEAPVIVAAAGNITSSDGEAAVGAAVPTNTVHRDLWAYVGNKDKDGFTADGADNASLTASDGSVEVEAVRTQSLVLAIGVSGIGADSFSLGGSAATNSIESSTVDAHVWGGTLDGSSGVKIHARDAEGVQAVGAGNLDLSYLFQASGSSEMSDVVDGREFLDDAPQNAIADGVGNDQIEDQQQQVNGLVGDMPEENPSEVAQNDVGSNEELLQNLGDVENGDQLAIAVPFSPLTPVPGLGGALGATSVSSVGVALANNLATDSTVTAFASDATVNSSDQTIEIEAVQNALMVTIAGSGSASQSGVSVNATEATTEYEPTTEAYIDAMGTDDNGAIVPSTVTAGGNVLVETDTKLHAVTVAGNIAFNAEGTSVAVGVATLKHTDVTKSWIDNADVTALATGDASSVTTGDELDYSTDDDFHGISVTATSEQVITTVAAGISADAKANESASVALDILNETTTAKIHADTTLNDDNTGAGDEQKTNVFAWNDSVVHGGGGAIGLSGGGTWAVGLSSDTGKLTKNTIASLESSTANGTDNMSVQALSGEKVASYVGTVEVSKSSDAAATAGIYLFDLTTEAYVGVSDGSQDSTIATDGSLLVAADDVTRAHLFAGSVGISLGGNASVGASFGDVHISKHTTATIYDGVTVTAKGVSSTDALAAAAGGFDENFDDANGDLDEIQPPNIETNDLVQSGSPPVYDKAYSKTRHATPTPVSTHGVAVTATGQDVVKGMTFSGGGFASGNFDTAILVRTGTTNTTASIEGDVTADANDSNDTGQNVLVSASHDYHQLAVAGALAVVGKYSAVPAVSWSVPKFNTTATIGADASVTSAGDTSVVAKGSEHLTVVTAGFAAGSSLAFDAQAAVDALTTTVTADVESGATVSADGNVLVSAEDNTHATHVAGGAAVVPFAQGAAGAAASFVYLDVDKTTVASISDDAVVDGRGNSATTMDVLDGSVSKSGDFPTRSIHGVAVQAQSLEDVQNDAVSGAAGPYAGVGGGIVYTRVHSTTQAVVGDGAQINQSTGTTADDQSVSVTAGNDAQVTNWAGGLVAGITALGGAVDVGIVRNNTTASVGQGAAVDAASDVDVHAVSRKNVASTVLSSADGALGIGGSVSVWTLGKKLESTFDTVSTSGNDALQLHSDGSQSPEYNSFGAYGDGQANRTDATDALNSYDADQDGPEGSLLAAGLAGDAASEISAATPLGNVTDAISSDATGSTTAEILGETTGSGLVQAGNDLRVTSAERTDLEVFTGSFDLDIVGLGPSIGLAQVRGGAIARAGGSLSAGGDLVVSADSNSDLDSRAILADGALAAIGAGVSVIDDYSIQQATVDDTAIVAAADSVSVTADREYDEFRARSLLVEVGGAVAGASIAEAKVLGSTEASVGNADFSNGAASPQVGDVIVTATSKASPLARADAVTVGIFGTGDGNKATSVVKPTVDAHVGEAAENGINLVAFLSGDLQITANSTAEPDAEVYGVAVTEVGANIGVSQTNANASPTVNAYLADGADVTLPGDGVAQTRGGLAIKANTVEDPASHGRASGGSAIASGLGVDSQAYIEPVVTAYIGADATIVANLDVVVEADDTWAGTAAASGDDFAGLAVNQNNATTTVKPEVTAYSSASKITTTNGAVTVTAESGEPGTLEDLTFDVSNVSYDTNTITFDEPHGLETGDSVIYNAGESGSIGGLEDGEAYTVYRVSDTAIKFVYQFDSGDVDPDTGEIYNDTPHGIETGAPVIYDNNNLTDIVNLENGQTYYVSAIDPHNLRLAATQDVADNLHETPFYASNVDASADTIQLETVFAGEGWIGKASSGDKHVGFSDDPKWTTGTAVYYLADNNEIIEDLSLGTFYYVSPGSSNGNYHFYETYSDAVNDNNEIKFHDNHKGLFVEATSTWRGKSEGLNSPESQFSRADIDTANDQITFTTSPPVQTGDVVGIEWASGTGFSFGISEKFYYYAHVTESGGETIVKLALSQSDLNNGVYLDFVADGGASADVWTLTRPFAVETGDALTYRAPLDVHFTATDIESGKIVVEFDEATTLFYDLLAYHDHDADGIVYDIASTFDGAEPIDGLTPGQSYAFDVQQTDVFELTIELTGMTLSSSDDNSSTTPVDHVLRMAGHSPIDGLVDGNTYYMITTGTAGLVKVAASAEDAATNQHIQVAAPSGIVEGDTGGTHFFGIEGISIAPPASDQTGIQQLTIDLTDSGVTGTQGFVQAGSTEDVDTISGRPTVKSQGINGDLIGGVGTQANATIKPTVTAYVGDPAGADTPVDITIIAADFLLSATAAADVKAESIGYDVSVGAGGGAAFSTVNMFNTAETYVGAGTTLDIAGNATIRSKSTETVDAKTDMVAGGTVDVSHTDATVNIGRSTTTTLGTGSESEFVTIETGGTTTVEATSTTDGTATGKAHAYGGIAIAVPHVTFKVGQGDYSAATEVDIGDYATFSADTLQVTVNAGHSQLKSSSNARTGDLFGGSNLDAVMKVDDHANLTIGDQVTSTTTNGKTVEVELTYGTGSGVVSATSQTKSRTLVGGDYATATTELTGGVTLDGQFADGADDNENYSLKLVEPSTFKEHHKSVTYYLWFIKHKKEGGSPSSDLTKTITPAPAAELGTVELVQLSGLEVSHGDQWYHFRAKRAGTLLASVSAASGSVRLALYDSSQSEPPLAISDEQSGQLEYSVTEGQTYLLRILGDASDVDLMVSNLISTEGTEIRVFGTNEADQFVFVAAGSYLVTIDGIGYQFDAGQYETIVFDGRAGDDVATLTGGSGDEIARFFPDHGTFGENGFLVTLSGVSQITAYGGGGTDAAFLYDSPGDDIFIAREDYGRLSGEGFSLEMFDFMYNYGYATTDGGGFDVAYLSDSVRNDKFKFEWPNPGQFYGKMYRPGQYYSRAKYFERIDAVMSGEHDQVRLYDSEGDETFHGQKDESSLTGDGFEVTVKGYDTLIAYASSGNDIAYLEDSEEDDTTRARAHKIILWGGKYNDPTYELTARRFDEYHFSATRGGYDRAKLHDTVLSDHADLVGDSAELSSPRNDELHLLYEAVGFDWVKLYSRSSDNRDTLKKIEPLDYELVYDPDRWDEL